MLRRITDPFWVFQESARFGSTFFPLIPFPRTIRKWASSFRLYQEISHTVNERIVEGRRENDYVQEMIDQEATTGQIALHVVGALFAAIIDSTGVAAYFLIFVGTDEMCMSKLRDEMEGLLRQEAEKIDRSYDEVRPSSLPLFFQRDFSLRSITARHHTTSRQRAPGVLGEEAPLHGRLPQGNVAQAYEHVPLQKLPAASVSGTTWFNLDVRWRAAATRRHPRLLAKLDPLQQRNLP